MKLSDNTTVWFPIEVGRTVYLTPTGNAARHWDGNPIEAEVTMIGRKYFYVQRVGGGYLYGSREAAFLKDSYVCEDKDFNHGYQIFESLEAYEHEQDRERKLLQIRNVFGRDNYCLIKEKISYEAVLEILAVVSKYIDLGDG